VRRRFFVEPFSGDRAVLQGEAAHHLGRVLRAQTGQLYELSDGERVRLGRVENVGRDRVEFALLEELAASPPSVEVTLLLAVVKYDAFEWAIEKATELGVGTIGAKRPCSQRQQSAPRVGGKLWSRRRSSRGAYACRSSAKW